MATTAKILAAVTPIGCRIGTDDPNYLAPYCRYTGNNNYCLTAVDCEEEEEEDRDHEEDIPEKVGRHRIGTETISALT